MRIMFYQESKEVTLGGDDYDVQHLHLVRERHPGSKLAFRIGLSKTGKSATFDSGDVKFHPETFYDARKARKIYDSISSSYGFAMAVEEFRRVSKR